MRDQTIKSKYIKLLKKIESIAIHVRLYNYFKCFSIVLYFVNQTKVLLKIKNAKNHSHTFDAVKTVLHLFENNDDKNLGATD